MAEIKLTRIRSAYGDLKGQLSQLPLPNDSALVEGFIVDQLNETLDQLTTLTGTDYSSYKIPQSQGSPDWPGKFSSTVTRTQMGRVISRLEEEYGFGQAHQATTSPAIAIFNQNSNEVNLQINYTIDSLIEQSSDEEEKTNLKVLQEELDKPEKDWDRIKIILIWIINFSKDLFLKIVPIILSKKL